MPRALAAIMLCESLDFIMERSARVLSRTPITLKAVQYDVESMSSCVFVFWHRPVFGTPRKYESSDGCGTGDYSGGRQVGCIAYLGSLCNRAACSGRLAYARSPTHSLVNSLIYPLTPPPARSLTHSPNHHPTTHSLTHPPTRPLARSTAH